MFKSRTTIVIGAGASLELGFPTSNQLKATIANELDMRFEFGNRQIRGSREIAEQLTKVADPRDHQGLREYNAHLSAGLHISRAMPQAISVDNFVDSQQDPRVTTMAKLGIASCLIDEEKKAWEKIRLEDHLDDVRWDFIASTWFHGFFQNLHEGKKKDQLDGLSENVQFVIFNYDRVFEFLLAAAIVNYFGISRDEAENLVNAIPIYHPYGKIGRLPFQPGDEVPLSFGSGDKRDLLKISQSLLTFSEQIEDEDQLNAIKNAIEWADQLLFLGFSYNETNMELLRPKRGRDTQRVIGTAYGLSEPDVQVVRQQMKDVCMVDNDAKSAKSGSYIIDNNSKCAEFFGKFRKSMMA